MGEGCKARVLNQIISFTGIGSAIPQSFSELPMVVQTKVVLGLVLDRNRPGSGELFLRRLWGDAAHLIHSTSTLQHEQSSSWDFGEAPKEPLRRWALQLACGMLEISPWEVEGLPVAWAMPLAQQTW